MTPTAPPPIAAPCPAATRASVERALRRAGERASPRLSCIGGKVVLELETSPSLHAELSVDSPAADWVGPALVRIVLARALAARGHPVLRFDYTGAGDSSGGSVETSLDTHIADLSAAIESLVRRYARLPAEHG